MSKVIILGSGAAPGVPCISQGFGCCDPKNPKNFRTRTTVYMEISGVKFLIDTSPDLRWQLVKNQINQLDAIFYTHTHADHLHGIDDLREINRLKKAPLDIYATAEHLKNITKRFGYLLVEQQEEINPVYKAALTPHIINFNESFAIQNLKITPIALTGHSEQSTGYVFNDGEIVHIADFKSVSKESLSMIKREPDLLIMPLTTPDGTRYHASLEELFFYTKLLNPKKVIINHMAVESDYEQVKELCLKAGYGNIMEPAYDGLSIETH